MMLTNKLIAIVNAIIDETDEFNRTHDYQQRINLTINRIQRLLYLIDIEHMLRREGTSMFKEDFYAWSNGPTVPAVYYKFNQRDNHTGIKVCSDDTYILYPDEISVIKYVLNKTWDWDVLDLNALTKQTAPWKRNYIEDDPAHKQIIQKAEIYKYYYNSGMFWEVR